MLSASGRYVLIFNGEIYNYLDLRRELEAAPGGMMFRGASDTEVMLAAFERWGVAAALKRLVGMFAIALWDRHERCLFLARDRMGEKPLYYGWVGSTFAFGSELKALRQCSEWRGTLNRDALTLLLRHSFIPGPFSVYEGIYKLPPATFLCLRDGEPGELPEPVGYWSLRAAAQRGLAHPSHVGEQETLDELEALLRDAVRRQMMADVPLGAFLSGGIDSSTVVALMQAQSGAPVRTFSIGFTESHYDEARHARAVARHLGTDHTELYVTPRDALDVIPQLPAIWDEPFADSSQIPTYLVAKMARQHVTVVLSGDAGDELFAGYPRYFDALAHEAELGRMPNWLRRGLQRVPRPLYGAAARGFGLLGMPAGVHRMRRLQALRQQPPGTRGQVEAYRRFSLTHWQQPEQVVIGAAEPRTILTEPQCWIESDSLVPLLCYLDLSFYLPEDILVKVDRASMAVSLESRIPLLDHRVVEFAQRLPPITKIRNGTGKWALRQVLYRYVPPALVERPKMGFGVPVGIWMRNELRDWAETLLEPRRLRQEGFFDAARVRQAWEQHQLGTQDYQGLLWDVLMFQQWHAAQSAH